MMTLRNLRSRNRQPELMDQPGLAADEHRRALRALARVNRVTASYDIVWPTIRQLAKTRPQNQPLRVLDIATGAGDLPIKATERAAMESLPLEVVGCDVSELAVSYAREKANSRKLPTEFFQLDVLNDFIPNGFDVVMCSLFLHHLSNEQSIELLRRMASAAGSMVLVSDLRRTPVGYAMAYVGTRILSRSPIVRFDGPVSVEGAYTSDEALELAKSAGITNARIQLFWPQRFLLSSSRS